MKTAAKILATVATVAVVTSSKPSVVTPSKPAVVTAKPAVVTAKPSVVTPSKPAVLTAKPSVSTSVVSKPSVSKSVVSKPSTPAVSKATVAIVKAIKPDQLAKKLAVKRIVAADGVKIGRSRKELILTVVISAIQTMISQISAIPEPLHPNYKKFVRRLVSFLQNEQRIMYLVSKVAANEQFIELIQYEGFDNSSNDNMMNIVQDNLLETFAEDTVENMENSARSNSNSNSNSSSNSNSNSSSTSIESYVEPMDSYQTDPSMSVFIYVVLAVCAFLLYKNYGNKA
jgi:hypothetical protein